MVVFGEKTEKRGCNTTGLSQTIVDCVPCSNSRSCENGQRNLQILLASASSHKLTSSDPGRCERVDGVRRGLPVARDESFGQHPDFRHGRNIPKPMSSIAIIHLHTSLASTITRFLNESSCLPGLQKPRPFSFGERPRCLPLPAPCRLQAGMHSALLTSVNCTALLQLAECEARLSQCCQCPSCVAQQTICMLRGRQQGQQPT